ncbi:MAG: motility associated factor glycosyltransferase family protein [Spirochaetales bacterium]|nr:motility associated factor glycosyltransferase family protein [Spirochaetales bacterium]
MTNDNPGSGETLDRNLLALASRNPELSILSGRAEASKAISFVPSKTGLPVPRIVCPRGDILLHSSVDPEKEALRLSGSCETGGYIIFLGLGGGFQILPFLQRSDISGILVIDKDVSLFRSILARYDLRKLILDPRVYLLIDSDPQAIASWILSSYIPAIMGDIQTLFLRPRMETEEEYFRSVLEGIKGVLGKLADDYTVQTHFGKKWFINTLANLETAEESTATLSPIKKAFITGAGPSLERQLPVIREQRSSATLIATDTSLPCLLEAGIPPDLVISIDCQQITYHHFLAGYPEEIPLVLDLASPAGITRLSRKNVFFSSGHPFSQYVNSNWRHFPRIDISGGNVSHAAVSLADTLGAEEIRLYGTDFSFPEGKSYARGSYLYPYFMEREYRSVPLEGHFYSFLMRNKNIVKEYSPQGIRYTTKPMISYKERLEEASRGLQARLIPEAGLGVPLMIDASLKKKRSERVSRFFSAGKPECPWREFLADYHRGLTQLPEPFDPLASYFEALSAGEKDLWTTLYPAAAVVRKSRGKDSPPGAAILSDVRTWSLDILRHYL